MRMTDIETSEVTSSQDSKSSGAGPALLVLYCLPSPLLIIVLASSVGATHIACLKNAELQLSTLDTDHAAFYDHDALVLAPGKDTGQRVGFNVDEV